MHRIKYILAALAVLALWRPAASAAQYWLYDSSAKTLTLADDEDATCTPVKVYNVTAGTSGLAIGRNSAAPYEGCAYGGARYDFSLTVKDAGGTEFSVVSIASYSFQNNNYVASVKLPSTITTIGQQAFENCDYLTDFVFAEGQSAITSIGIQLFRYCDALKFVEWPVGLATLPNATFAESKLLGFYGPSVTTVDGWAFQKCPALKTIEFGAAATFAGANIFQNVNPARKRFFFRAGPPTVNKYFTGYDGTSTTEGNSVFDWNTLSQGVDFFIPLNATGDGPTSDWTTFKTDFEANDAGNTVTWPTSNGDGTWTAGSIYSARHKRSAGLCYWEPGRKTTAALLAH